MSTRTTITQRIRAPRAAVYQALVDAGDVATWMVPDGMTSHVHAFDAREGGAFRISLTYDAPTTTGKTTAQTDTFHGTFVRLVADREVTESIEFESDNPQMQGEMLVTITLRDAGDGETDLDAVHDRVPPGVRPEDNELGWRISLGRLARLVETRQPPR